MGPKRLVLLVEGQGDVQAAPVLVKRLLTELSAFDTVYLDPNPFRVGGYSNIIKNDFGEWRRFLKAAAKRRNIGGCILLLDGDSKASADGQPFCAKNAAQQLISEAQQAGAGHVFSTAVVFACMEFESWLIAGAESLVDKSLSDGRSGIRTLSQAIPPDPEKNPRDAKGWFRNTMAMGYKPTRDQAELTQLVDLNAIRNRGMRSFRRLEKAVSELISAIRSGNHVITPTR